MYVLSIEFVYLHACVCVSDVQYVRACVMTRNLKLQF